MKHGGFYEQRIKDRHRIEFFSLSEPANLEKGDVAVAFQNAGNPSELFME